MNRANFLGQSNKSFPTDCETLDFMQANNELLSVIGQIAGDKIILSGCVKTGSTVAPGYIYLKTTQYPEGEVLKFDGGTIDLVTTTVYISENAVSVTAYGYTYPQAYYTRSVKAGLGSEQFLWADFTRVETNAALKARVKALEDSVALLAPTPIGIPQPWSGYISKIPTGMVLYDGRALNIADYPAAYNVWGTMYNTQNGRTTPAGQFRIPDMGGMFPVGYSAMDDDYNAVGKQGGAKEVALTAAQNGPHTHAFTAMKPTYVVWGGTSAQYSGVNDNLTTAQSGNGEGHENLPPFITLAWIGRIE